jgi:hypothetical protein
MAVELQIVAVNCIHAPQYLSGHNIIKVGENGVESIEYVADYQVYFVQFRDRQGKRRDSVIIHPSNVKESIVRESIAKNPPPAAKKAPAKK